jgi:outer membrane protein assembly factor BamB
MRNLAGLVAVAAIAALLSCTQTTPTPTATANKAALSPAGADLAEAGLGVYYTVKLPLEGGERIAHLYQVGENLYALTNHNRLIASDAATSRFKWAISVGGPSDKVYRPVHADSVVIADKPSSIGEIIAPTTAPAATAYNAVMLNTVTSILVINRDTGHVVRTIKLDMLASSGGDTDGSYYYVGSISGLYCAIDLQEQVKVWTLHTDDTISASLEYFRGKVFVGSHDKTFREAQAGRFPSRNVGEWMQSLDGADYADFDVSDKGCFVPCLDGKLYGFKLDGPRLWEPVQCKAPLDLPVQVGNSSVFQADAGGNFYAIDVASGAIRWTSPGLMEVLGIFDANACILNRQGQLEVRNEASGELKDTASLAGFDRFVAGTSDKAIFAANSRSGQVVCIRPLSAGHLTADMFNAPPGRAPAVAQAPVASQPALAGAKIEGTASTPTPTSKPAVTPKPPKPTTPASTTKPAVSPKRPVVGPHP